MPSDLNTSPELKRQSPRMAILPVGATEQHGPHLPLATDTLMAHAIAVRMAEKLNAYCLSALPFSISHMHRGHRGSVWLRNSTLAAVIRDLAASLFQDGFTSLVLVNFHGGNHILVPVVQDLNLDFPDTVSMSIDVWKVAYESGIFGRVEGFQHGEDLETSCMLYLYPPTVKRREIRDHPADIDARLLLYGPLSKIARHGTTGYPTKATAEKGRRAVNLMVKSAVQHIQDTLRRVRKLKSARS
jgi:creatinine amidohydrolase